MLLLKNWTVLVEFCILPGSSQPILARNKVTQLQVISIDKEDISVFRPVKKINTDYLNSEFAFEIASIIQNNILIILKDWEK